MVLMMVGLREGRMLLDSRSLSPGEEEVKSCCCCCSSSEEEEEEKSSVVLAFCCLNVCFVV